MDSLKSLMDKKQYDLVIKLTENAEDSTYLFYRISALLAIGQPLKSLDVILTHRKILEKDLGILIKVHIEILCLLGRFDEAYEEMKYYEALPYVSQQVEELLRDMPKYIRAEEKKMNASTGMNDEQVKKMLHSKDKNDVIIALDIVRERDINVFLPDLKRLMVENEHQSLRSFALFVLVQKGIDGVFEFKHIDKIIEVNPSLSVPPFTGDKFNNIVKKMASEFSNPSLSDNATQIYSTYIMYLYPEDIPYSEEEIIEALYEVSTNYLQAHKEPLEDRCSYKGLDIERVKQLIREINEALENF